MINEILKIVDWIGVKVRLQASEPSIFPYRKEIWWASLGQNIGVETNGKNHRFERPVIVIKVFNVHSLLIAPITSNTKERKFVYPFTTSSGKINIIKLSQLRTISTKRLVRKIEEIPDETFNDMLDSIINNIFKTKAPFGAISESPQGGPNTDIIS